MKILQINKTFESFGGIETHVNGLIDQLQKDNHEIKKYSPKKMESIFSIFSRFFSVKIILDINKIIKDFQPDVVHLHEVSLNMSPSFLILARKYKIPFIMTAHHYGYICPKQWMIYEDNAPCEYGISYRCLVKNCKTKKQGFKYLPYHSLRWLKMKIHKYLYEKYLTHIISPSEALASEFRKHYKISSNKVSTIYNFSDLELMGSISENENKNNKFLFVGRLSKEKGCASLIRAIKKVKQEYPDVKLNIIGDGPERNRLNNLVIKMGLENNVDLLGTIEHASLSEYYRNSSALIVPSIGSESFGLVILEAYANLLPVIGSDRGSIPELVENKKTGLLFGADDINDLAEKIIFIIKNPSVINIMKDNIKSVMGKFPTRQSYSAELEKLYNHLIRGLD